MGEENNILRRMMSGDIGNADILGMVIAKSNKSLLSLTQEYYGICKDKPNCGMLTCYFISNIKS